MAIVTKIIKGHKYLYEVKSYRDENGKVKKKWTSLGRIDDDNPNAIHVSKKNKKKALKKAPAHLVLKETTTEYVLRAGAPEKKPEVIEPEIASDKNIVAKSTEELKIERTKIGGLLVSRQKNQAFYDEKEVEIKTASLKKKDVITLVSLEIDELKRRGYCIPSIHKLTPFDGEILCAAISLYEMGNEYMSAEMVYRTMAGNKKDIKLTPQMKEEILNSFFKLSIVGIIIYAEQEVEAGLNTKSQYRGPLLANEIIENEVVSINGREESND